jgi:hypothetical protein
MKATLQQTIKQKIKSIIQFSRDLGRKVFSWHTESQLKSLPQTPESITGIASELSQEENLKATIERPLSNIDKRYNLLPQLKDSDNLPLSWQPYLMRWTEPNYRSSCLTTNELGFRTTLNSSRETISYETYLKSAKQRAIFSGNSVAFGIGVSHDALTVPSLLNHQDQKRIWYNFGMRAFNLTQERLALDFYAHYDTSHIVFLSGLNNLIVTLLGRGGNQTICPFVGEPNFFERLGSSALITSALPNLEPNPEAWSQSDLEQRYQAILHTTQRDFYLLSHYQQSQTKCKLLFCLQPALAWTHKTLTPEEKELVEIWDDSSSLLHRIHLPDIIGPWQERFTQDLHHICLKYGIEFLDLNVDSVITGKTWIFADRVHLTDQGHQRIAQIALDWVDNA